MKNPQKLDFLGLTSRGRYIDTVLFLSFYYYSKYSTSLKLDSICYGQTLKFHYEIFLWNFKINNYLSTDSFVVLILSVKPFHDVWRTDLLALVMTSMLPNLHLDSLACRILFHVSLLFFLLFFSKLSLISFNIKNISYNIVYSIYYLYCR